MQKSVIKELNPSGQDDAGLIIDESAIAKKGNMLGALAKLTIARWEFSWPILHARKLA